MNRALAERERHAPLAAKIFRRPCYAIRKCDVDRLVSAVDDRLAELCADLIGRSEKSDVLSSKIRRKTRHEHGRAHDLGIAGRMMDQWVARWRHVRRIKFKGLCSRNELIELCSR